jgi:hypothetical protein
MSNPNFWIRPDEPFKDKAFLGSATINKAKGPNPEIGAFLLG